MSTAATENQVLAAPRAKLRPTLRFIQACKEQNTPVRLVLLGLLIIQAVVITWMGAVAVYGLIQGPDLLVK